MADQKLIGLLRQGPNVWNRWRVENRKLVAPDLRRAELRGADLVLADLSGANLSEADLCEANLRRADLSWVDLSGANLCEADLPGAFLHQADLHRAVLVRSLLQKADLSKSDLSRSDLSGAILRDVDLRGAYLSNAVLSGSDLGGANLSGADLTRCRLDNARVGYATFGNLDLSDVIGLEDVVHDGPSTIGVDTVYRSQGKIPEIFLRGAGMPESFITYARSLIIQPIELYSCFISYSSKDQGFAKRLYADLQARNVRCWFAPEDMKIGERIRDRIDLSIRVYDKLLLVLSENSIQSEWVESEVEAALEREQRLTRRVADDAERPTVLFPIRLDDAVNDTPLAWAATIRRQRHIGDFSGWKDHDSYQKALTRLLRDLKVAGG